jgi:hypothetical protein
MDITKNELINLFDEFISENSLVPEFDKFLEKKGYTSQEVDAFIENLTEE